jgi:DNA-binding CsgD family transcriptional regulator
MSPASITPPPFMRPRHVPLRGREEVVSALVDIVRSAGAGHGAARTLVGEAGIGKTSVIDEVVRRSAAELDDLRIVRIRGLEAEVEMAWSGLAGLLDGFLDHIDDLPPARAAAIRGALALSEGGAPVEPFAVAVATRDLLAEAGGHAPILVVVDDVTWIDLPSRLVLSYLADHVELEPIAVIAARRLIDSEAGTDLGAVVEVGGLAADRADELLEDAGVVSADVRRRLREAGGGNPLVLVEAANLLDDAERSGRALLPDPLPVGHNGQRAAELALQRLDPATRAALVVVAADPDGDAARLRAALAANGHAEDALQPALDRGVLEIDGDRLLFRHPLIRAATYHGAPRGALRAAHRALASTLPERSPARAWHLARSALGPDEEIADALDAAATMTAHIGAPNLAARTWEAASRLSPDAGDRTRRLRLAASAGLDAGLTADAGALLARAEQVAAAGPDDPLERSHRLRLRCRLPPSAGGVAHPTDELRDAARAVVDSDVGLAADLLLDTLERMIDDGALADILSTIDELAVLRDRLDEERARRVDIVVGGAMVVRGDTRGEALLDRYREIGGADRPAEDARFLVGVVAPALGYLRRTAASNDLLDALEADLRARGAVRPLVDVLAAQAMAHHGRSFPASLAAAVEAMSLAQSVGVPEQAALAASALALAAAVVGDRERCEQAAALLATVEALERRMLGPISLAYLALNEGRLDDADELYRRIADELPLGRGFVRWETEWVETLAKSGRRGEGAAVLDQLVDGGRRPDSLLPHEYERARGFVAVDEATAHAHFARSIENARQERNPFAEGRARLAWGEQLRRVRRRADAREHLDEAFSLFTAVGANSFADRAATEARAAGGQTTGEVVAHRLLTPHELQIARLVVGGASTRDVAAKLFISPRTIEAHLSTIFRKLGVRNRGELSARALEDPILQP